MVCAFVYILECADGTYYTGWTDDPDRRLKEHNSDDRGAKYTRSRRPCRMVYVGECGDKSAALKREWEIKNRLSRKDKEALVQNYLSRRDRFH